MELTAPQPPRAVFRELGSVVTVEPKWSLEGVFPSRAVFKVAARHETRCEWAGVGAMSQLWDRGGRTFFVANAHCDDRRRFVVQADEKVTAFLELEQVTRESWRFQNAD
jgi:hypothetical protein